MDRRVVEFIIKHCSPPVLDAVFDRSYGQDEYKWHSVKARIRRAEDGEDAENDDEKEVHVRDIVELEPQVLRNETVEQIVVLVDASVAWRRERS